MRHSELRKRLSHADAAANEARETIRIGLYLGSGLIART